MLGKNHSKKSRLKMSLKRKGKLHPNWKGGKILVDGYYYLWTPNHPNKTKNGYVCEHRLVMEKNIGRFLNKKEVIHHINCNKLDNRIENLELVESTGKHFIRFHLKSRDKLGRFKDVK